MNRTDVAIVGGGIVGLRTPGPPLAAVCRWRCSSGIRRRARASVRNFGMVWPIGQPPGLLHQRALRSRERWLELGAKAGLWVSPCGSLHLAYEADELAVLEEFAARAPGWGFDCRLLTLSQTRERSPAVEPKGLLGALYSPVECCVDPRQAIARLPGFLAETYGVQLNFGTTVRAVEPPRLHTSDGRMWLAGRILVCSGTDFETLFPEVFAAAGLRRCKLHMMRTVPQPGGWRLGPHIAGGLTLCHYAAFRDCPSLPRLQQRIAEQMPDFVRFGIHVMASQNHLGEVVIGDSHEYDADISLFDKTQIDASHSRLSGPSGAPAGMGDRGALARDLRETSGAADLHG